MKKNTRKIVASILFFIIIFMLLILLRSANWFLKNFKGVEFATAIYQIFSPLKGTESELIKDYCRECL
ncbi:MAG: hypothetical protein NC489_31685 [Ruminococcus flavefaciens]|nr:hypothetical protein [Ruminococcus flavefaciens]